MAAPQAVPAPLILVVDDELAVLRLMARALDEAGYQVQTAGSPVEALYVLSRLPAPPAVLVTDLRMAPMDGVELAGLVMSAWPGTRVIFVSGYGLAPDQHSLPGHLLAKPFPPDDLVAAVEQLIGQRA